MWAKALAKPLVSGLNPHRAVEVSPFPAGLGCRSIHPATLRLCHLEAVPTLETTPGAPPKGPSLHTAQGGWLPCCQSVFLSPLRQCPLYGIRAAAPLPSLPTCPGPPCLPSTPCCPNLWWFQGSPHPALTLRPPALPLPCSVNCPHNCPFQPALSTSGSAPQVALSSDSQSPLGPESMGPITPASWAAPHCHSLHPQPLLGWAPALPTPSLHPPGCTPASSGSGSGSLQTPSACPSVALLCSVRSLVPSLTVPTEQRPGPRPQRAET